MDLDIKIYSLSTNATQIEIIIKNYNSMFCKQPSATLPLYIIIYHYTPRQFLILINDSDLRETDLHETSKRKTLTEQTVVVREVPCFLFAIKGNSINQ